MGDLMTNRCPNCGAPYSSGAAKCEYCGTLFAPIPEVQIAPNQQPSTGFALQSNNSLPVKSRIVAAILAILLGGIGVHKFYLGKTKAGILMLVFSWTSIPSIIAFLDFAVLLAISDQAFMQKYNCRIK